MNKIKIQFCDTWVGFDKTDNFFYNFLSRYFDVEISENPDFLFYSIFGIEYRNYKDCVKIFFTGECTVPNFNECDYAIGFDNIKFDDRYLKHNTLCPDNIELDEIPDLTNRRFCNFIYSNSTDGEGAILRQDFFKKLSEYKHIDAPGKVCNNMQAPELEPRFGDWHTSKAKFIGKYKFTIAFENCKSNGYVTEKFFQPIQARSIPIYWGAPDIAKDFNPKAFINCNDYKNFDEVIEVVKYLDNNDEAYLKMLNEPFMMENSSYKNTEENIEKFLMNIVSKGNKPFNKDPHKYQEKHLNIIINSKLEEYKQSIKQEKLIEKIFSLKNEYNNGIKRKVLKIFGIKIKFKQRQRI